MKRTVLPAILLTVAIGIVFGRVLANGFIAFDDPLTVLENPNVLEGFCWSGLTWAFSTGHFANWAPLTWMSHQLDVTLYSDWAGGHHLTSLLLHVAGTLAVYFAFSTTLESPWIAALVAALYGLHPLHVESVAWVSERKGILSSAFGLWALAVYCRQMKPAPAKPVDRRFLSWQVCALYAASLMSKQMLVTLPILLLLLDYWPLQRNISWRLIVEKAPLIMLAAAFSAIAYVAQSGGSAVSSLDEWPLQQRAVSAAHGIADYLLAWLVPHCLSPFYPLVLQESIFSVLWAVGMVIALAALVAESLLHRRQRPWRVVGWLWFLIALLPVCGFVTVGRHARADRYSDIPLIGVNLSVAVGLAAWASRKPKLKNAIVALATCWVAALGWLSFERTGKWRDTEALFSAALECNPGNYMAHNQIGVIQLSRGSIDEARTHFEAAIKADPSFAFAHVNLGRAYRQSGQPIEAERAFAAALAVDSQLSLAWHEHGLALAELGQLDAAAGELQRACELNPRDGQAFINLGSLGLRMRNPKLAQTALVRGLQLKPDSLQGRFDLARTYLVQGRKTEAQALIANLAADFPENEAVRRLQSEINSRAK